MHAAKQQSRGRGFFLCRGFFAVYPGNHRPYLTVSAPAIDDGLTAASVYSQRTDALCAPPSSAG